MPSPAPAPRYPAIDVAKGVAILWVLLIHPEALGQRRVFFYLVFPQQLTPVHRWLYTLAPLVGGRVAVWVGGTLVRAWDALTRDRIPLPTLAG